MKLMFFKRARRKIGVLWLSPDAAAAATYSKGITKPSECRNSQATITVLGDPVDEAGIRAWALENRVEVERIVSRSDLLRFLQERFLTEKNALIVGRISGWTFLGLFREGVLVFEHFSAAGAGELDKALKHCVRQSRGATTSYAVADSIEAFEELKLAVKAVTGDTPRRLAAGPDAMELLAGAAAEETVESVGKYSMAASIVGFAVLAGTLATDYALHRKLDALNERRSVLEAQTTAIMSKAVEIEHAVDGGNSIRIASSSATNIPEAKEILLFLSRAMPQGVTVDELTADGTAAGQAAPYEGIRAVTATSVAGTRFFIRGSARDLDTFSKVLRAFDGSEWIIETVQKIDETGAGDFVAGGYDFLIAVRRHSA